MNKTTSPRGIAALPVLAIVLVLALVLAGAAYFATRDQGNTNTVMTNSRANANSANANTVTANGNGNRNGNTNTVANANATVNANSAANTNEALNSNTPPTTNAPVAKCGRDVVNWETYTAPRGFSFSYPNTLHITTETASGTTFYVAADDRSSQDATYTTSLSVWINRDGYGGVTGGKLLRIQRADGGLNIVGEDDATHAGERFIYSAKEVNPPQSGEFDITLWNENNESPALEQLFRSILCTFRLDT